MYLYGASGHAKVIIDIACASGETIDGIIDDNPNVIQLLGYPVSHDFQGKSPFIVSIGDNEIRKKIAEKLDSEFIRLSHPSAIISPHVTINVGTVVMQGAIIQASTKIGKHCIINTGASIDHDCSISDYCHISPHATLCGNVTVEEGAWIGAGATVTQGVKIGKWATVGVGAVVINNIPDYTTVVGNPAKEIK